MATAASLISVQPRSGQPEQSTFRLLLRTMGHLRRSIGPFFAEHGISHAQWQILATLFWAEDQGRPSIRLTDLCEHLCVRPPTITNAIDRLVRAGLVQRISSSQDQREKHARLTAAGRKLVHGLHQEHTQKLESLLAVLSPAEQKRLNALLLKLATENQSAEFLFGTDSSGAANRGSGSSEKRNSKGKNV